MPNRFHALTTAAPGWFIAVASDAPPFYDLIPVACWAAGASDPTENPDSFDNTGVIPLVATMLPTDTGMLEAPEPKMLISICHESGLTPDYQRGLSFQGKIIAAREIYAISVEEFDRKLALPE